VSTNRINAPDTAEQILQDGTSDLISMARPLLADPDFIRKAMHEKAQAINTCIACNQACLDHAFVGKTASCLVNPSACHESELDLHSMNKSERKSDEDRDSSPQHFVLPEQDRLQLGVIGAGPAGIAFACTAAELGHTVTVFERSHQIGGQFHMAKRVPGKEEFYEAIRYWENRLNLHAAQEKEGQHNDLITVGSITVKLNTEMTVEDMATQTTRTKSTANDDIDTDESATDESNATDDETTQSSIDKWIVSTGVIPRDIHIPGAEHWQHTDRVLSYVDVLRHNKPVGKRVAVIGAGGIGFDVAEFLLYAKNTNTNTTTTTNNTSNDDDGADDSCPAATVSKEDFWKEWGVDPTQEYRGGLVKKETDNDKSQSSQSAAAQKNTHGTNTDRSIYLMQRKKGKVGGGLGRTTGWIHRASLKHSQQVTNIAGVHSYDYIDENTGDLVYTDAKTQQQHVLAVDTIISCAGQLEERTLERGAKASPILHHKVYPIGGAYQAGELDAKRAIDMGTRLAHHIHHPEVTPGNHVFHASVGTEEKLFRFLKKWT